MAATGGIGEAEAIVDYLVDLAVVHRFEFREFPSELSEGGI